MATGSDRLVIAQLLSLQLRADDTTGDINCVRLLVEERTDDKLVYT